MIPALAVLAWLTVTLGGATVYRVIRYSDKEQQPCSH